MSAAPVARLLHIEALRCWFRAPSGLVRAVEGVSLSVDEGEALGVVGESGSGKTQTFFSILALSSGAPGVVGGRADFAGRNLLEGLDDHVSWVPGHNGDEPVLGRAHGRWAGERRRKLSSLLGRELAMLFQDSRRSLVPYWTVQRHLVEVLRRQAPGAPAAHDPGEVLAAYGFRDPRRLLRAFPGELSGGEAQRVMLAMTVAMRPRLLVADEPTTALDALNQARVLEELAALHASTSQTMVLISHDLAVLARVVERVVVFFGGRVVERAAARDLLGTADAPRHPYSEVLRDSHHRRAAALPIMPTDVPAGVADRDAGCPYHLRCALRPRLAPRVQARCRGEAPPEVQVADGHYIACWGISE